MEPPESELVRRFQEGDEEAAGRLIRKYARITLGLVYSNVGPVQDAEDLVQDVFLEAQKSVARIRNPESFASWLYKITQRVCNRWVRETRRSPASLEEPEAVPAAEAGGEGESATRRVHRAVEDMPAPLREVVYMRYFENLSYERMGEILGISPSAVNARLMKARKLLRTRLDR